MLCRCDICGKLLNIGSFIISLLKKDWLLYCEECAEKLHLSYKKAVADKIVISKAGYARRIFIEREDIKRKDDTL